MIWTTIITIAFLILLFNIYFFIKKYIKIFLAYHNFEKNWFLYESIKSNVYQNIYREFVLPSVAGGYTIKHDEIEKIQKIYIEKLFKSLGNNILENMIILYGDLNSFSIYLIDDLVNKIEEIETNLNINEDNITENESDR